MISISHAQARRLIHAHLDNIHLPEEQWMALHAHLEACAECRAYRARLTAAERSVHRTLHQRWDPVEGPSAATAAVMAKLYHELMVTRRVGRRMLSGAAVFLVCVVLIIHWTSVPVSVGAGTAPRAAAPVSVTLTPKPTLTPTPSDYRGAIAYEYRPAPSATKNATGAQVGGDIYLLNIGSPPINLTNDPADDHDPAWSPDGNWLAFLSDRTGKDEVYVMHISGTRLTRLTDLPDVTWSGPLSWSADGQMLALVGKRKVSDSPQTWVYIVPVDGSNAYPLGASAGAIRAAFSPMHNRLAFSSRESWGGGLVYYDFDSLRESFIPVDALSSFHPVNAEGSTSTVSQFDWTSDGTRLLYRVDMTGQPASSGGTYDQTELRRVDIPEDLSKFVALSRLVSTTGHAGDFPAFSWTGVQDEIAYLAKSESTVLNAECSTLRLGGIGTAFLPEVNGLCVETGLERANWHVGDKSLLVIGHEPEGPRGLYVVRFLRDETRAEWLADASGMAGPPRLRPVRPPLAIDPKPTRARPQLPASPLPGTDASDLLVTRKLNDRTLIERLSPDSSQRTTINQSVGENTCPVWSPDHTRIAFLSDRANKQAGGANMPFVMDGSGLHAIQLPQSRFLEEMNGFGLNAYQYDCPVWSADGHWLAMPVTASTTYMPKVMDSYLAVIPVDKKDGAPRYLPSHGGMAIDQYTWLPDGRLLVAYASSMPPEHIILSAYQPTAIQNQYAEYTDLFITEGWTNVTALSVAPDGKTLAMAVTRFEMGGTRTFGILTASLEDAAAGQRYSLKIGFHYEMPGFSGYPDGSVLGWLSGGKLGFILRYPAGRRVKAEVFSITPDGNSAPESLASFYETLLASAWSPDGRWLTAITETGRYVLDATHAPGIAPARVDGEMSSALSW